MKKMNPAKKRCDEIRCLMQLRPEEVKKRSGDHLRVLEDLDALHKRFARDLADLIQQNNSINEETNIIIPVGPTGQYPYFVDLVEKESISLSNCRFFFMDEYCDANGEAIDANHPLSFKGIANRKFLKPLLNCSDIEKDKVYFPDGSNLIELEKITDEIGQLDACFGGIGIHGHIAFNEPEPNVKEMGYRKVALNNYTITINAVRAQVGGNLECFPKEAFTIGMKQILLCKKIMLYCRNGTSFDWANTILRIALLAQPGDDYPVTHIRNKDYVISTDMDTLKTPVNRL